MEFQHEARCRQLLAYMEKRNIDVSFIVSPIHIYYFTGYLSEPYERFMALAADARSGETKLFVPGLDLDTAREHLSDRQTVPVSDTEHPLVVLKRELGAITGLIGIEKKHIRVALHEQLVDAFPHASFIDLDSWIMSARMKKSEEEMEKVRQAVLAAEKVMEYAVRKAHTGMAESELAAELEYQTRKLGNVKPAFEFTVLAGRRSALPHGKSGTDLIKPNDFVVIDIGVRVDGYCSDITRTFIAGEGTKEQENMYAAVLEANRRAIEAIASGIPIGVLDQRARKVIESKGYGRYFTHRLGHGFGMEIHEPPSIHGENGMPIEAGMLFTVEPGIYIPSVGGVRIEDDVFIREDGTAELLTQFPKELRRLEVNTG